MLKLAIVSPVIEANKLIFKYLECALTGTFKDIKINLSNNFKSFIRIALSVLRVMIALYFFLPQN